MTKIGSKIPNLVSGKSEVESSKLIVEGKSTTDMRTPTIELGSNPGGAILINYIQQSYLP